MLAQQFVKEYKLLVFFKETILEKKVHLRMTCNA